ncbi:ASCH domain-containing protein [Paracoccaceae bacterium GXU_MW_L88]
MERNGFILGDSRALNTALLEQIRTGAKTASCGALRDFEEDGEALPEVGRRDMALDWDAEPALVVETTAVEILPFSAVIEDFAKAEGAADLASWQADHRAYFERNGGFAPDMKVVCERFKLVEVFS